MNHQGLLCSLHCAMAVVLREQLNFQSAVIRSERSSCSNKNMPRSVLVCFGKCAPTVFTHELLTYQKINDP